MNREIKFRAWNPNWDEMVYSTLETVFDKREFYSFGFEVGFSHYPKEGWIITQYTGLKDKNGKEIYEGDICIVSLSYFKIKDEKATVIFHNGAFQFQYGCEKFFSKPHDAWDEVEVIGNIYENKELLQN